MARSAILPIREVDIEVDIFSNKSALVLFWLLANQKQFQKQSFSVNELSRDLEISIGLVHKVIKQLEYDGIINSKGLRTNKKFFLKSSDQLLISWVQEYSLLKKTKTKGFATSSPTKTDFSSSDLLPALHTSSAEFYQIKTTNLSLKEFYVLDWDNLPKVINKFHLQELDRGYEILLVKPYYSSLLQKFNDNHKNKIWKNAYAILTFLDLCHFPVRGIEQAQTLFRKLEFMKSICSWSDIENAIG